MECRTNLLTGKPKIAEIRFYKGLTAYNLAGKAASIIQSDQAEAVFPALTIFEVVSVSDAADVETLKGNDWIPDDPVIPNGQRYKPEVIPKMLVTELGPSVETVLTVTEPKYTVTQLIPGVFHARKA